MSVTPATLKVEVKIVADELWYSNAVRFTTLKEACAYAVDLYQKWTVVERWRVVDTATGDVRVWQL